MDSSNQEPNIKHHRLPNYYDRREDILIGLRQIVHQVANDEISHAIDILRDTIIRLKNLERG